MEAIPSPSVNAATTSHPEQHAAPASSYLYGLRNNTVVYASSVSISMSAYDDLPDHQLVSVRNLITSTPNDPYLESEEEFAFGLEQLEWDYSGLQDRGAFSAF